MNVLPARLRDKVQVRDNVSKNLLSLTNYDRKDLWRTLSKAIKSSLFHVHKRLDQSMRFITDQGVKVYGTVVRPNFIAIVQLSINGLMLYSVISRQRLHSSKKVKKCVLVKDRHSHGTATIEMFAGVDEQKNIVWRQEIRDKTSNRVLNCVGEMVLTFDPNKFNPAAVA